MEERGLIHRNRNRAKASLSYYICIAYVVSILLFNLSNHFIPHVLFLLWIVSVVVFDGKSLDFILSKKYYLALYIFLLYYFLSSLFAFPFGTCVNRVYTTVELISPFIMYELYRSYDIKKKRVLCFVFIGVYAINFYQMLTTINYSAVAGLRQHEDEEGFLNTGFHFIYSLTLVLTLLIYVIRMNYRDSKRLLLVVLAIWLLSIILIVFKSLYTTAILLMGIGAVIALFYGRKHWKRRLIIASVVLAALFVYVTPYLERNLLSADSEYAILTYRFEEISSVLSGGDMNSEGSGGARFNRTLNSLNTFISHPLFGVNHKTNDVTLFEGNVIGNHAEWVDSLAKYGIFALLLFYFLVKSAKQVSSNRGVSVVFILFIVIGFLNQVLFCVQNTVCFFIIPMFYDVLISKRAQQ